MKPSEKNNFEEQWKRALEDASVPPPKSVWDAIEAKLEEQEEKIVPLAWWQARRVWLVAASLATLMLVGGGIWYQQQAFEVAPLAGIEKVTKASKMANSETDGPIASSDTRIEDPQETLAPLAKESARAAVALKSNQSRHLQPESDASVTQPAGINAFVQGESPTDVEAFLKGKGNALDRVASSEGVGTVPELSEKGVTDLKEIAIKPVEELEVLMQKRYVFFRPELREEPVLLAKEPREYWAGLSFMPASFNPDLKVVSAPESFQSMSYARQSAVSGGSKAGASYAFQTQAGLKVSKHWSLEMGLSYLQANSQYEGGGYLLSASSTNLSTNVVEAALADANSNKEFGYNSPNSSLVNNNPNKLYIDVNNVISNDYRYLQLPVQAGFTLNPEGKWNYAILGGVMTNFFLKNELQSSTGGIITTKPGDEVYRSVNLSATTGLRVQYKLSEKWRANLTGSYQQGLTSGFYNTVSLQSKPHLYGVAWGVRYSF
ncbi:hypothetical protein CLV98_11178 [Dyadobacter jejuensis]|uniref:Outer membrane protein with beta-barrel domain n=1 Tax=Dyadobacter jejuensis TaxID=1082580 RepID=A0A316AI04_9BACT|nr:hypothetical protein [Dyadobacter jejuensis]PWJ56584.1 hypothetical protein CLV98_11178 [Dyadobacter jejuensis]